MALSSDLISQFVKVTKDEVEIKQETTVYGTIVEHDGSKYVKLDGSDLLTPISSTAEVEPDERVTVMIKNHTATVTGNISSPSARVGSVEDIGDQITEVEILVADKVSTSVFNAEKGRIDELVSDNILVKERLTASEAVIDELEADNVTINGKLTAQESSIESLETHKLTATDAALTYATIENLNATNATVHNLNADYGEFKVLSTNKFSAIEGDITDLETNKLSTETAAITYANIDFSNIGEAAINQFYAKSGIIENLVIENGTVVSGEIVGVTIKGDLIEGNTVVADKLVIKGTDGLYYKLNTDGVTTEAEQTEYNSLNGSVITAKSITATKISVSDLVAFDATIGGFNITESSIYSGVKESVANTTQGIYLDDNGQMAIGDGTNYLKYYQDTDGTYKLAISASNIIISSSNKDVVTLVNEAQEKVDSAIVDTVEEFYQSTSPTSLTGGTWSTTQPTWTEGTYIWRRTLVTYGDDTTSYTPSENGVCITGNTGSAGPQGEPGSSGKGVLKSEVYYYLSTSNTTQTGDTWLTTPPAWVDGRYYWQKIVTTYTDNTTSESTPVCITGGKGATGATGEAGATGQGISSITTEFYLSTSKTEQAGGEWTGTMPTWSQGNYLWTRSKIVYTNPSSTAYTEPICDSSWEAANLVDEKLDETSNEIHQTITDQNASIVQNCNDIILQALTSYTETGDFDSFKQTTESQLQLLSDQLSLKFTETQNKIDNINADLQSQLNTITKYFTFDVNGLTIGQEDSPYKVIIDNDRYSMTVNDVEVMWIANGKVYTPEIEVTSGFKLLGYSITQDGSGNVNCEYVGGE